MTGRLAGTLAHVGLAVLLVGLGYVGGRRSAKVAISKTETTTCDTVWTEIHDTCWRVESAEVIRTDTVRLARVVCAGNAPTTLANVPGNGKSGTYQDGYVHGNGISGTYHDTLAIHDSVYVEIPIERKVFTGDNWRVTAHGYRVGIDEVWINRPTIYVTKTQTKTKRWAFNVGAQIGYGYTVHGGSPYIGLGIGFGYTF